MELGVYFLNFAHNLPVLRKLGECPRYVGDVMRDEVASEVDTQSASSVVLADGQGRLVVRRKLGPPSGTAFSVSMMCSVSLPALLFRTFTGRR